MNHPVFSRRTLFATGAAALAVFAGTGLPRRAFAASSCFAAGADIETVIAGLSRRQKLEQMLMPDFRQWNDASGTPQNLTVLNDEVRSIIDEFHFGGVILFLNNVAQTEQTLRLCADMQAAALANSAGDPYGDIPLLIGIDQEGGIVYRLGSGCNMPGNMAVGATRSEQDAVAYGDVIGSELDALKINVNFAPSLDVNSNPNNPVIGLRSVSSDPQVVSDLGIKIMSGMQKHGVAVCAKHFPGHGDVSTDSHVGLPRVDRTLEQLDACEFIPFKAAFASDCDMVMSAHIQFPLIETETVVSKKDGSEIFLPATLSQTFMTDVLRDRLGFSGVVSTDALNMGAIAEHFDYIDAVRRTFMAGVDIALMPVTMRSSSDVQLLRNLLDALEANTDDLPDSRLDASVRRILTLKKNRGILGYRVDEDDFAAWLEHAEATVGGEANRAIEREISADAVTVVRNEGGVLPFRPAAGDHVLLVAAWKNEMPGMDFSMRRMQAEGRIPADVTWKTVNYVEDFDYVADAAVEGLEKMLDGVTHAVIISEISRIGSLQTEKPDIYSGYVPAKFAELCAKRDIPVAVMSISQPYDVALYDVAPAVCAVFGYVGMDPTEGLAPSRAFGPNVPAGIEVIFGAHAAQGAMPVDIPCVIVGEEGAPSFDLGAIKYPLGFGISYLAAGDGEPVSKEALASLVRDVERDIVPYRARYTVESYARLDCALEEAHAVLGAPFATQRRVDAAHGELLAAREALVLAEGTVPDRPDGSSPVKPSVKPAGGLPRTGDPAGFVMAATGLAGAVAAGSGMMNAYGRAVIREDKAAHEGSDNRE